MDMNVFCSEDELRKQADTFTGKENIWGVLFSPPLDMKTLVVLFFWSNRAHCVFLRSSSPARRLPSTNKRLREDLHKKVVSEDPVAARLPYAILTKMVTFLGWKRFEMNETLKFHGVTEMTFPSMMRRSLILDRMGRFACAQRLASLLPGTQGYSLVQQDMKDFVTSQPAAGALLTIVLGELCDFLALRPSGKRLKDTLEGGGDGGVRRATTRAACGLPAEDVALHPDGASHAVAPRPGRGGDRVGEAGTWLAPWRRRGACPVPCVSREALPGERLGLQLGEPRQQVAPGRVAEGAGKGPCGDPAATEGERVVEGATAERQVRGAVDPAHPVERGVLDLLLPVRDGAEPVAHR